MTEETSRWRVGSARITSIVEAQTDGIPPAFFFPEADEQLIAGHAWLRPHYADEDGRIGLRVQGFVVEAEGRTVVVDPCVGNDKTREQPFWNEQSWPFLGRFEAAGFDRHDVELVVHTHLHVDHVGWDTQLVDGRWVPTFPRARYVYVEPELAWSRRSTDADSVRIHDDSVGPVFAAGLADLVPLDADLGGGSDWSRPWDTRPGTRPCGSSRRVGRA